MIIKSLSVKNFRQFTGEQTIKFSTDSNKKVTLIIGESGFGKTTLIQSFQWVLYGTCKYSKILNESLRTNMKPDSIEEVSASVSLLHNNREYNITRKQIFRKLNKRVDADDSTILIDYKDEEGISKQVRGRDATSLVKQLMHQDLFPYFFLEGESLTRVGEQMSRGKSGSNNDFAKAVKGLLGFNHLYETIKHLETVCDDYEVEISKNTSSKRLKEIIEIIQSSNGKIRDARDRIHNIDNEIYYNTRKRDELNDKLMAYGEIESKQKRTKVLQAELNALKTRINDRKKALFKKMSSNGFYLALESLLLDVEETMKDADSIDKGIPGMNADAIHFLLANHRCICGEELIEGSDHWNKLLNLLDLLPPNNIGFEIETFKNEINEIKRQASYFDEDYTRERKCLSDDLKSYNDKTDELIQLNKEIGGVREDIGKLKEQENDYNQKIVYLMNEKHQKENLIKAEEDNIARLETESKILKSKDEKTKKIQAYYFEAEYLKNQIVKFVQRKENDAREKLAKAINEIFKDFYEEIITFTLDSNYGVQIKTLDYELSNDFTSGGQDVAVALAFIGAVIKVNGEKVTEPDDVEDEVECESYPLVLDAPVSNFGMKQMESFSDLMPKIADQIIVFINDVGGPILKDKMISQIGSEYHIVKEDTYHSDIVFGGE